jgi:hypothetical protein
MSEEDWRLPRVHKFIKDLNVTGGDYTQGDDGKTVGEQEANIITSQLAGQQKLIENDAALHAPVLDIDFGAQLLPSSTPGHFHLYFEKAMTWDKYCGLLKALGDVGILEAGYVKASLRRGYSSVRKPGVYKQEEGAS